MSQEYSILGFFIGSGELTTDALTAVLNLSSIVFKNKTYAMTVGRSVQVRSALLKETSLVSADDVRRCIVATFLHSDVKALLHTVPPFRDLRAS